ncbi:MAG: monovalent cation/H+ antiporter subunit D [Thalassolituus sp.]|jgi:multicomponent K+:H+ antiporter subunit D|uniref:monovalent cation/H+ antiporter subunit D n=1 Tax=Thalassolituus sp. TaxID=2030822 RepID=UPI00243B7FF6|nr:monovalent cation/H+ antiporter subunit D [Pseudomonadota bacterium]MEC8523420.1 monovalent cation/H+ antiporter subunit D [Pseudomonadota bacterium]TNC86035.1 MAG: monovalent cation/H+ antiporter subunit D [Thalassolituus sp.]
MHLPALPVLLPFFAAVLILFPWFNKRLMWQRVVTQLAFVMLVGISCLILFKTLTGAPLAYALGDWEAPFGIYLLADPLAAFMLVVTSVLALCTHLYACGSDDKTGRFFHPLFLFQLMGLNGAFLTADAFNLFVFFEILLIASYSLLIHGGGRERTRAAQHYVLYNLIGSAFFLIALALLYRAFGTLSIPHMALLAPQLAEESIPLAQSGGLLLMVVFGVKAALLPLHFWLPRTYSTTSISVAALFAVMTKVGVYSLWRIHTVVYGHESGELSDLGVEPLAWLSGLTVVAGSIGALASQTLRWLIANLIIISVGTLLMTVAMGTTESVAAGMYYTLHSTLMSGAFFLIAGLLLMQRGQAEDRFVRSRPLVYPVFTGVLFAVAAMAMIGLPPFSGFLGKVFILQAAVASGDAMWVWPLILLSGLVALISLSRAGTTLFWRTQGSVVPEAKEKVLATHRISAGVLVATTVLLVVLAGPLTEWSVQAAEELHTGVTLQFLNGGQP